MSRSVDGDEQPANAAQRIPSRAAHDPGSAYDSPIDNADALAGGGTGGTSSDATQARTDKAHRELTEPGPPGPPAGDVFIPTAQELDRTLADRGLVATDLGDLPDDFEYKDGRPRVIVNNANHSVVVDGVLSLLRWANVDAEEDRDDLPWTGRTNSGRIRPRGSTRDPTSRYSSDALRDRSSDRHLPHHTRWTSSHPTA